MAKGLFITLEGADGAGKTTQLKKAADFLKKKGYEVITTREPGGTKSAEKIRDLVLDKDLPLGSMAELLLYLAARSEHVRDVIAPALKKGTMVLCDRYSDSTLAYQGMGRELDLAMVEKMNAYATGGLEPDLTVLLDADPEKLLARRDRRGVTDRFEAEGLSFQQKLRDGFLALAARYPARIKVVDALGSEEEVAARIAVLLEEKLGQKG